MRPAVIAVLPRIFAIPPEPGSPRRFHLLSGLAERAEVHCIAASADPAEVWQAFLREAGFDERVGSIEVHRTRADHPAYARALTLLSGRAPWDLRWKDPDAVRSMHAAARRMAERAGPAVFLCLGVGALQFVPRDLWRSCVVDSVDPHSLLLRRSLRTGGLSALRRLELSLALPLQRRFEAAMLRDAGAVVYNSSADIRTMRARHPDARIVHVIDGCDVEYFDPARAPQAPEEPDLISFNGNLKYPPNADAAIHLATEILPRIWKRRPGVSVRIVGPDPPPALRRLHDGSRVYVTGRVEDVRPELARAALVVSPLRYGAGMKNKLQAALCMEKAVVASSATCEGFDELESGRHAIVADDPDEFAAAVCKLLDDPERRAQLGAAGAELIRSRYTWDVAVGALWDALAGCTPAG
jgi:glycosyltransferase involved in cell wall biosynthesis